jgi:hypothetical protein
MLLVAIIFSLEANVFAQKFPIADFLGTNIRREDPMKPLKTFGFVREYHDWVIDQGDQFASTYNAPGGTPSLDYPSNFFRWNPPYQGQTWEKFPSFYTSITSNLQETILPTPSKPICASMKSSLPRLSGTGGFQTQSATGATVSKPYWDIAMEFKPVKTNRSISTGDGTLDLFVNPLTLPPTTDNLLLITNSIGEISVKKILINRP